MWARVARFEGDPADIDARLERLRSLLESGDIPPELADSKFLLLVDRVSGGMLGVTLFASEEAMRRGDEVMNAGPGNAGSRSAVEFYEVPIHTLKRSPNADPRAARFRRRAVAQGRPATRRGSWSDSEMRIGLRPPPAPNHALMRRRSRAPLQAHNP